jgi:Zn-dependent peptidase ImmA (M78 family)/transcriptional regulator with XRE-family HTH domain
VVIFGEKLRLARELQGLTQVALADRVGVTQGVLSHFESGRSQPPEDVLQAIALQTGFLPVFFQETPDEGLPIGSLAYRAHSATTSTQRAEAHRHGEIILKMVRRLSHDRTLVAMRLPRLSEAPESAAQITRSQMGLAPDVPISNLVLSLERMGVIVLSMPQAVEKLWGYSTWTGHYKQRPVIVLSNMMDGGRQRLTTAHEAGHLVLDEDIFGSVKEIEDRAFRFAAELLLPERALKEDLTVPLTLSGLAALKPKWKVSMQALIHRAGDLEIISARQSRYLYEQVGNRGWKLHEPIDLPVERPRLLRQLAEREYGSPIDVQQLALDLKMSTRRVRDILEACEPQRDNASRNYGPPSGVIELADRVSPGQDGAG